jgi:hypothetical protein
MVMRKRQDQELRSIFISLNDGATTRQRVARLGLPRSRDEHHGGSDPFL